MSAHCHFPKYAPLLSSHRLWPCILQQRNLVRREVPGKEVGSNEPSHARVSPNGHRRRKMSYRYQQSESPFLTRGLARDLALRESGIWEMLPTTAMGCSNTDQTRGTGNPGKPGQSRDWWRRDAGNRSLVPRASRTREVLHKTRSNACVFSINSRLLRHFTRLWNSTPTRAFVKHLLVDAARCPPPINAAVAVLCSIIITHRFF